MKVAVLGSSGQVGSHLVNYLKERDHVVHGYDIVPGDATDFTIDLSTSKSFTPSSLNGVDFVYFLAFDVGGSRYLKQYQDTYHFMHNNTSLMSNVFNVLQTTNIPFIFTSSQMANMSYSPYGILKTIGELYTKTLNGLVVKFWNVYGVEHDLEKSHVITDFIIKARDTGKIDMMTDGTEVRQFLHADDCSECLEILAQKYSQIDRSKELHVTNFQWHSILEVANMIVQHFPKCKVMPSDNKDTVQQDKRNEPDSYILNYWQPRISLPEGIDSIIKQL
jgi:nucleoside-diphosphate-sugar epimerase